MYSVIIKINFSAFLSQVNAQTIRMQLKLPFLYSGVQKDSFEFINQIMISTHVSQCLGQGCHINDEVCIFPQS